MIKDLFKAVMLMNENLISNICEISVKVSDISVMFEGPVALPMQDILTLDNMWEKIFVTEITTFDENIYVNFRELQKDSFPDSSASPIDAAIFYKTIMELRNTLCKCPALEFVVSPLYLKVFLDIPNIEVKDVCKVDGMFNAQGYLELNDVRPYILYINDAINPDELEQMYGDK